MRVSWVLLAITVAGCGLGSPIDPAADEVVDLRVQETERIRVALSDVVDALGGEALAESHVDRCYSGQRNYKVDTGYSHRCSLMKGVLIGFDGDFRNQMLLFDGSLAELGWESDDGEWPGDLIDEYWELREGEASDGTVLLGRLPGVYGIRQDEMRMLFSYSSNPDDSLGRYTIDLSQGVTGWCCGLPYHAEDEYFDVDKVADNTQHEHLVLITIQGAYFEK